VEVRRSAGLTTRRSDIDGFAGAMTRLRATYDALHQAGPMVLPPDVLIDAMQSGDRLGYHPETAADEISHFRQVLPQAQAAVGAIAQAFAQRADESAKAIHDNPRAGELEEQRQHYVDSMTKAQKQVNEAGR
jgi:hypothetical protein